MIKARYMLLGLGAMAVAAAGGSAATNSNTLPAISGGYGTTTITGATATSIKFNLNAAGTSITSEDLVFSGDLSRDTVQVGFNGASTLTACDAAPLYDGTADSSVTCTLAQSNSTATSFAVSVAPTT